jgi:hypothetical protein
MNINTSASHASNLSYKMASWKSVELIVRQDLMVRDRPQDGHLMDHSVTHYIETNHGQRFLDLTMYDSELKVIRHTAGYADGKRFANVDYDRADASKPDIIFMAHSFRNENESGASARPIPLKYLYVGKSPIYEVLPHATAGGESEILNRPCDVFVFKNVQWTDFKQTLVYHLDRASSFPLRIDSFLSMEAYEAGTPLWIWEALSLEDGKDYSAPVRSQLMSYDPDTRVTIPSSGYRTKTTCTVQLVRLDKEFNSSVFWPKQEPGVRMVTLDGKPSVVNSTTSTNVSKQQAKEVATVPVPIRIEDRTDWATTMSVAGLALGIACVVTGVILWWRRR